MPDRSLTIADRFARVSLEMFGNAKQFSISAPSFDELDEVVRAFEALGCEVKTSKHSLLIRVTPPGTRRA